MTLSRHKHTKTRPLLRRFAPVAGPIAALAIVATGSAGVPDDDQATASIQAYDASDQPRPAVDKQVSRSGARGRAPLVEKPAAPETAKIETEVAKPLKATGKRYVTTELNVRTSPGESSKVVTVLPAGTKVAITEKTKGEWAELVYKSKSRWVRAAYLAKKKKPEVKQKPDEKQSGGISDAACESGSSVENGLKQNAVRVHRAVCANFPDVSSYGGLRADGEHGQGQALDVMVSGDALGDEIADWVRANSGKLGVSEVIWSQTIWTTQRSSEGWRSMSDRGSATANHNDHVHVTVEG